MEQYINKLIERAATTEKSEDAMRFSQAACNVANALLAFRNAFRTTSTQDK